MLNLNFSWKSTCRTSKSPPELILMLKLSNKMFASENYSHRTIFMYIARKILSLAFGLIFFWKTPFFGGMGLTHSKTANMFKWPYLFLLRQKLKALVNDHREIMLKTKQYFPSFQRDHGWKNLFSVSSDDLASKLSYKPNIKLKLVCIDFY